LSDYVPFYFTTFFDHDVWYQNRYGVRKAPNDEIAIFVSSLHEMAEQGIQFVLRTSIHTRRWPITSPIYDLDRADRSILQNRDFRLADPGKKERCQKR
jgi:hypothetical protein